MRIDAHQHFWRFDPVRDAWITPEMSVIRRDFYPTDLLPELKSNGIDATIAVQADQSEQETAFLLDLASRHPQVAGVVGWADLCAKDIDDRLLKFSGNKKLRGFRHIVQAEPDDRFLLRDDFCRGVFRLGAFGFAYDILVYPRQLPAVLEFVQKFPGQKLVIDHLAKPPVKSRELKDWAGYMRLVAACPNVYCKVSGMVTEADWKAWQPADFSPYLDVVFEAFGPERLMFGSDWPVCLLAGGYSQVVQIVRDYLSGRPVGEGEAVFGGTAAKFYGLGEGADGSGA